MLHHPALCVSRRALLGAGMALPVATLAACGAGEDEPRPGPSGPLEALTYLTSFQELGRDAYAHLALVRGMFAEAGFDVTIQPGSGTNGNLAALLSGQAQFVVADLAGVATVYGTSYQGPDEEVRDALGGRPFADVVTIAAIHQRPLGSVMALEGSGITSVYDLPGRTVGLPVGASTAFLFPAVLESAGIDPDEVDQVPLEGPALIPAVVSGQVDAIGQFVVGRPLVESAAGQGVVVMPYDEFVPDQYGVGLLTTRANAESNPDACGRFRDALLAGLQAALDDPAAAGDALLAHVEETVPEVAAAEMELMIPYSQPADPGVPLGHIDSARLARHIATLTSAGLRTTPLEPDTLAHFPLVPGAEAGE